MGFIPFTRESHLFSQKATYAWNGSIPPLEIPTNQGGNEATLGLTRDNLPSDSSWE